jgi:DNA-binding LacI/PurR family transcriptional regulator
MISSLELARLCGVSQGTVDRALHDRPGVAVATRKRILSIAQEHGYVPNPAAREMMGLATSTLVGAVAPESSIEGIFFTSLFAHLSRRLRQAGLRLVITFGTDPHDQAAAANELTSRRVRALLLIHPVGALDLPSRRSIPHLALIQPSSDPDIASLLPDEEATGRIAAEHLLARGHRRLIYCGGEHGVSQARGAGFLATCHAAGAHCERGDGTDFAMHAIRSGTTAVFCHNDPLATQLIAQLGTVDIRAGRDVAVVGVDGAGLLPDLTTIVYPYAAIADAVIAWLDHPDQPLPSPVGTLRVGTTS